MRVKMKALSRLLACVGSHEPYSLLFAYVINALFSWAGAYIVTHNFLVHFCATQNPAYAYYLRFHLCTMVRRTKYQLRRVGILYQKWGIGSDIPSHVPAQLSSHWANLFKSSWSTLYLLVLWHSNSSIKDTVIFKRADCGINVVWKVIYKYQKENGP